MPSDFKIILDKYGDRGAHIGAIVGNTTGAILGYLYIENSENVDVIKRLNNALPGTFVGRLTGEILGRLLGKGAGLVKYYCLNEQEIIYENGDENIRCNEDIGTRGAKIGRILGHIVGLPIGFFSTVSDKPYFLIFNSLMSSFVARYAFEHVGKTANEMITHGFNRYRTRGSARTRTDALLESSHISNGASAPTPC
jgi:hypothetical protein